MSDKKNLSSELARLESRRKTVMSELERSESEVDALQAQVNQDILERGQSKLHGDLTASKEQVEALRSALQFCDAEIVRLKAEIKEKNRMTIYNERSLAFEKFITLCFGLQSDLKGELLDRLTAIDDAMNAVRRLSGTEMPMVQDEEIYLNRFDHLFGIFKLQLTDFVDSLGRLPEPRRRV